jgi:hypothetical protein
MMIMYIMIIDMKILALSQCFCDTFDENIVDRQKIFRRVNKGLAQVSEGGTKNIFNKPSCFRKNPSWRSRKNKFPSFSHWCCDANSLISFTLNLISILNIFFNYSFLNLDFFFFVIF